MGTLTAGAVYFKQLLELGHCQNFFESFGSRVKKIKKKKAEINLKLSFFKSSWLPSFIQAIKYYEKNLPSRDVWCKKWKVQ